MRFLRTNTAARVTVGPFFDKTDGVTPETAITVTSCKLTLMVDDANVPTLVLDTAPTASGGANDMVHVSGDDAGFYDLELAAANVNYLGRAMLAITDAATHCPVFHEFMILPAMIYDAMVLGTDVIQADVTQLLGTAWLTPGTAGTPDVNVKLLSGDSTAADNAEAFFDGTGYAGTNNVIPTVTTLTGHTAQTGDSYAIVNSGTHGNAAIKGYVDDIGVAGAGLTALGDTRLANLDAAVSSRMATYTQPTGFLAATFPSDPADQSLVIAATDALLAAINALNNLSSAQAQTAAAAALTAYDPPTNAEMEARTLVAAGYATPTNITAASGVALSNAGIDALYTRALVESYNTDGSPPTVAQALMLILQAMTEGGISGTTWTIKKLDGSTTAATITLDSATTPTSKTRAS